MGNQVLVQYTKSHKETYPSSIMGQNGWDELRESWLKSPCKVEVIATFAGINCKCPGQEMQRDQLEDFRFFCCQRVRVSLIAVFSTFVP